MSLEHTEKSVLPEAEVSETQPYEAPKVQSIKLSEEAAEALT
jgi:hypothetical protein